ncbi:protein 4.1b isoform X4 [Siphateles boraxobius]|uniref:protein 4.1b isoform X4 n=1 Tax=Siphateles boraxobius TaxID=180520 RepID=UPI004063057E
MLQCRVNFLDDTHFVWELERNAMGRDLFSKVCEHLDLLERDYYGLVMWDSPSTRVWLDCAKEIRKQIKSPVTEFFFSIKFYPPDPSILAEDITRYLLCLQLRKDILIGRLPCPSDILALLGSYTVQSTLGDYDPNLHKNNYVSEIVLAPNQSEELEERVMELHSTYRFMSPSQADMLFLENAMGLPMYGVDLHPGKDVSGADVMLGVCSEGLMVYEDEIKTNVFLWPRVLKISHKRSTFLLKIRPSEQDESESDVSFNLATYRACKQLWKCSVEHHSFFRNRLQDPKAKRLLTLGSRFRHHGRTQSECLEASGNTTRAPPRFTRYIIKRKANEEILDILTQPLRAEFDDWFLVYGPDKWHISTSDDGMLESQKLQEWKHHADDWCVLLDSSPFSISSVQQPLQTEELREDVEVVEGSDERLTDELVIKQSYKVQVVHERSDVIEKEHQEVMKPIKETLREEVLEVDGERIQRVVINKQWTQEVNSLVESQVDVEKKIERMEMVERRVMVTEERKFGSGDTFERLEIIEQRLEEVEAIKRKLVEVEELRVGLQEVESLEQRLQQVEKEELQRVVTDDWYILLDRRPLMLTPTPIGRVQEELQQIVYIPKQMKKDDDWYILLDVLPQTMEISHILSDVSSFVPEEYQAEEEKREVERKIQQELVPPEKPKTQSTEEVIPSRVETEEVHKEQQKPVTVDYGRPEPVVLKQRAAEPQTDGDDGWFVVLNDSTKRSVPSVELYEETREDVIRSVVKTGQIKQQEQVAEDYGRPQTLILEQRAAQPQRDVEDDWFIIFDVSPKESEPLAFPHLQSPSADLYEEIREEVIQSRLRTGEVQIKQQQVTLKDRRPQTVILEQRAAQPQRDVEDDWFIIFDVSPKESEPSSPQLRGTTVELYEETREEEIQSRVRNKEKVIEVMTVSTKEQITVPEKKRKSIVQTPQFPVVPREVDDDWFQLFDKVPYEQKSFPSVSVTPETRVVSVAPLEAEEKRVVERRKEEVQIKQQKQVTVNYRRPEPLAEPERDIEDDWFIIFDVSPIESVPSSPQLRGTTVELYEETREEEIQSRVRTKEKVIEVMTVSTKEQITVPEKKRKSIVQTPQFPVVPREVDDDWFQLFDKVPYEQKSFPSVHTNDLVELLDTTPSEKRSVPSVATKEHRIKEQEDRERQQEMRVREEEKRRLREQEKRKQELEARRAQPSITLATEVQPHIEAEDDWFILFDVSLEETDDLNVDRWAEEEKRRREEERRKQIRVKERPIRPSAPEKRPVQLQTELEDDWFTLMGVSPKDYVPTLPHTPVISPVAPPKPRPQIPADQPLTSTPTAQPVSITKTRQEKARDILNITLESEAETESVLMRKIWKKKIEGESIYVRHSILMLEDLDVSQELILKHHASITELKRVFMEVKEDFEPTEWDRRLSSYSPSGKAQLPHFNGEILIRMGLIEDDEKTVVLRQQETIYV